MSAFNARPRKAVTFNLQAPVIAVRGYTLDGLCCGLAARA